MTALITGATGGLGQEFAKLFAKDGHDLFLIARREDALNKIKAELEVSFKIKVTVFPVDLAQEKAAQTVFEFADANNIKPEFLVNNAGFGDFGFFSECDLKKQENMINLNILTLTKLCRLFIPQMIEQGHGKILNVASIASFMPGAKMSVYYASKAYVRSFSEALAVELKKTGISVTALCPGPVSTDFWNRAEAGASGLSKHFFFADSKSVAKCGYKKMKKGAVLALPKFIVKASVFLTKILPRSWIRNLIYWIQK